MGGGGSSAYVPPDVIWVNTNCAPSFGICDTNTNSIEITCSQTSLAFSDALTIQSLMHIPDTIIPNNIPIVDVEVSTKFDHTFVADLEVYLWHADTTTVLIGNPFGGDGTGCGANDVDVLLSDASPNAPYYDGDTCDSGYSTAIGGTHRPVDALSVLDGLPANGDWYFYVADRWENDDGVFGEWTLKLTLPTCIFTESPTTSSPTTSSPTTTSPTTSSPTTSSPTNVPTTSQPSTNQPSTSQPSSYPTTLVPTTSTPTSAVPTTSFPTTSRPTTNNPTSAQPTTNQPSSSPSNMPSGRPTRSNDRGVDEETTLFYGTDDGSGVKSNNNNDENAILGISMDNRTFYIVVAMMGVLICTCCILFVAMWKMKNKLQKHQEREQKHMIASNSNTVNAEKEYNDGILMNTSPFTSSQGNAHNGEGAICTSVGSHSTVPVTDLAMNACAVTPMALFPVAMANNIEMVRSYSDQNDEDEDAYATGSEDEAYDDLYTSNARNDGENVDANNYGATPMDDGHAIVTQGCDDNDDNDDVYEYYYEENEDEDENKFDQMYMKKPAATTQN